MNDPHVQSLHYEVVPKPGVAYENAPPIEYDASAFTVRVADGEAVFTLKDHFGSEDEAIQVVQPFVERWEAASGLETEPDAFHLQYKHAVLIDRAPQPGLHLAAGTVRAHATVHGATLTVHRRYPQPPESFELSPTVRALYYQYRGYRRGAITIGSAAYFCETLIQNRGGGKYFAISSKVLKKVTSLSTNKGGPEARKVEGLEQEFSPQERDWLEAAMRMMIRRAAERAAKPNDTLPQLTLADLPPLP